MRRKGSNDIGKQGAEVRSPITIAHACEKFATPAAVSATSHTVKKAKPRHRPQRPMTSKGEGSRDLLTNVDLVKVQPRKVSSPNGTNKKTLTQVSRNVKVSITPFCPSSSPQGFLHVGFSEDERFHFSFHFVVVAQTLNYNRDPHPLPFKTP